MDAFIENKEQFIELLKSNNMNNEEKLFIMLTEYLEQMDQNMIALTKELSSVKEELSNLQNSSITSTTEIIENTVNDAKRQVNQMKENINITINSALEQSKLYGKECIVAAMNNLNISTTLKKLKSLNENIINACDKMIDKLTEIGNKNHKAFEHLKNAGRTIAGKEAIEVGNHDFDKGAISGMQNFLFKIMEIATGMNKKLEESMISIEKYDKKVGIERESNKSIQDRINKAKETKDKTQDTLSQEQNIQRVKGLTPDR